MFSFSGATCRSHVRHNANYILYAQIRFALYVRESLVSLSIAMAFTAIKAYNVGEASARQSF